MFEQPLHANLDDIARLEDFPQLSAHLAAALDDIESQMKEYTKGWHLDPNNFTELLGRIDRARTDFEILESRPNLMMILGQERETAKNLFRDHIGPLEIKYREVTDRFFRWIKGFRDPQFGTLDDTSAQRLFASAPMMYDRLMYLRSQRKHTLTTEEERSLAERKETDVDSRLRERGEMISGFTYTLSTSEQGTIKINGRFNLEEKFRSADPHERREAYRAFLSQYEEHKDDLFALYTPIVRYYHAEAQQRGFSSLLPLQAMHHWLDPQIVRTFLSTVTHYNHTTLSQDYLALKAQLSGTSQFNRCDLYAPVGEFPSLSFAETAQLILDSSAQFSKRYGDFAQLVLTSGHVESHPHPGASRNAGCMHIAPSVIPYLVLSHTGDAEQTAHEVGHGVHSMYAQHVPQLVYQRSPAIDEAGSTLNEFLVFINRLAHARPEQKKALLSSRLDDIYQNLVRQTYLTLFEMQAHKAVLAGASIEDVCTIYYTHLKRQFGSNAEIDPLFRYEWLSVSHLYEPFTCYPYVVGQGVALALEQQYRTEKSAVVPHIERLLALGGSKSPQAALLDTVKINLASSEHIEKGLQYCRTLVEELKK